jgi:hypothetical protein
VADVLALLAAAVLLMGGAGVVALTVRASRRRAAAMRREVSRRLRDGLRDTEKYIEQVGKALSEDDLDSLEDNHRKREH